jgi:hypothetical protein
MKPSEKIERRAAMRKLLLIMLAAAFCLPGWAKDEGKIPAHAKFFLAPMGGFESDLKTAIEKKKVPVEIVTERDKADFEISGTSAPIKQARQKRS